MPITKKTSVYELIFQSNPEEITKFTAQAKKLGDQQVETAKANEKLNQASKETNRIMASSARSTSLFGRSIDAIKGKVSQLSNGIKSTVKEGSLLSKIFGGVSKGAGVAAKGFGGLLKIIKGVAGKAGIGLLVTGFGALLGIILKLRPVMDFLAVQGARIQGVFGSVSKTVEGVFNAFTSGEGIIDRFSKAWDALSGSVGRANEAQQRAAQLARDQISLDRATLGQRRALIVQEEALAEIKREIADTDKNSIDRRLKLLNDQLFLEEAIFEARKAIAIEQKRILEEQAADQPIGTNLEEIISLEKTISDIRIAQGNADRATKKQINDLQKRRTSLPK